MRHLYFIAVTTLALSACATQEMAPSATDKKMPQCWNGDIGKFQDVGTETSISGVNVECKTTTDGKAAQWMGTKH